MFPKMNRAGIKWDPEKKTVYILELFIHVNLMEVVVISNRPSHEIMNSEEMDAMNGQILLDNRLYSKGADGTEQVRAILSEITGDLIETPQKIRLGDTAAVEATTRAYVSSCVRSGVLPSRQGHARSMGVSRQGVSKFMRQHPEHETTAYLEIVYDAFAEALSMASLTGRVHPIVGIFVLKAIYGWRDGLPEEQELENTVDVGLSAAEIARKYAELPDE